MLMTEKIAITEFVNSEFKHYSNSDNVRSIPSIIDGFKDAQRKAVFGMTLFGKTSEKVSRLSSKIAVETNYHHGETSLAGTLVGLAQTYPGANNLNLLEPDGQFGSRLSSEASSERYISTRKSKWFDLIINEEDHLLLERKIDEGIEIEPRNFYPVLPLWLVNGVDGIGTGYSSFIYQRNPKEVSKLIAKMVKNEAVSDKDKSLALMPWFKGWKGVVVERELGKYEFHGVLSVVNTTTIKITELPINVGVDKYKQFLIDLMEKQVIKDFDNNSSEDGFEFVITVPRELTKTAHDKLVTTFNLVSRGSDVVTMWNTQNKIHRYLDVFEALTEFVSMRKTKYAQWKAMRLQQYQDDIKRLQLKADFIKSWIAEPSVDTLTSSRALDLIAKRMGVDATEISGFMDLPLKSLTTDKVDELMTQIKRMEDDHDVLDKTSCESIYIKNLSPIVKSKDF